ncbi:hypothetical protein BGZ83_011285, partial [Gryganskiella cystojenkinii]
MASSPQPSHMALSPHAVQPPHAPHPGSHLSSTAINAPPPAINAGPGPGPGPGSVPPLAAVPQQTPPAPSNGSSAAASAASNYRPLNVRDALSYLDQVKVQFQDHPD